MIPLEIVDAIDSTSDELKRRVGADAQISPVGADAQISPVDADAQIDRLENAGEMALMARVQTSGRGRLGRAWTSPVGNLYLSVLLRPGTLCWPGHWSILAAVTLAETVAGFLPDSALVRLKWPNDVLLGGGKLAGILLEAGAEPFPWLVIGFGVNLRVAPDELGRLTAALGPDAPAPDIVARALLARLGAWRLRYQREGFAPIRSAWLERAHAPGEAVAATVGGRRIAGTFVGLAETGALLLETDSGRMTVSSGELA